MNTTWQTVYEQLQEFLNESIKLWWKSKLFFSEVKEIYCTKFWLESEYWSTFYMSYHDLFSKDSGIIEFCNFKNENPNSNNRQLTYRMMSDMTAEEKVKRFVSNAKLPTKSE